MTFVNRQPLRPDADTLSLASSVSRSTQVCRNLCESPQMMKFQGPAIYAFNDAVRVQEGRQCNDIYNALAKSDHLPQRRMMHFWVDIAYDE